MSDVITREQAAQIERIKSYDAGCRGAFGQQMGYAVLAGMELNALKDSLPHGAFMDFAKKQLPQIPHRTATRYMSFAIQIGHSVANLPAVGEIKLLSNGELPEKERDKILKAVHDVADGKTLTELYRDLGVIRQPKPAKFNPRVKDLKTEISDEEAAEKTSMMAMLRKDMLFMSTDEDGELAGAKTANLRKLSDACHALNDKVQAILKSRKATK